MNGLFLIYYYLPNEFVSDPMSLYGIQIQNDQFCIILLMDMGDGTNKEYIIDNSNIVQFKVFQPRSINTINIVTIFEPIVSPFLRKGQRGMETQSCVNKRANTINILKGLYISGENSITCCTIRYEECNSILNFFINMVTLLSTIWISRMHHIFLHRYNHHC